MSLIILQVGFEGQFHYPWIPFFKKKTFHRHIAKFLEHKINLSSKMLKGTIFISASSRIKEET